MSSDTTQLKVTAKFGTMSQSNYQSNRYSILNFAFKIQPSESKIFTIWTLSGKVFQTLELKKQMGEKEQILLTEEFQRLNIQV